MGTKGAPPPKKGPGEALHRPNGARIQLTDTGRRLHIPKHIDHPMARKAWDGYWNDPVSSIITESDHAMLFRWIDIVQRYWRHIDEIDRMEPEEHAGDELVKLAMREEGIIESLETKLGIGPKARVLLGISIVKQEKGKQELAQTKPNPEFDDPDDDPRV